MGQCMGQPLSEIRLSSASLKRAPPPRRCRTWRCRRVWRLPCRHAQGTGPRRCCASNFRLSGACSIAARSSGSSPEIQRRKRNFIAARAKISFLAQAETGRQLAGVVTHDVAVVVVDFLEAFQITANTPCLPGWSKHLLRQRPHAIITVAASTGVYVFVLVMYVGVSTLCHNTNGLVRAAFSITPRISTQHAFDLRPASANIGRKPAFRSIHPNLVVLVDGSRQKPAHSERE